MTDVIKLKRVCFLHLLVKPHEAVFMGESLLREMKLPATSQTITDRRAFGWNTFPCLTGLIFHDIDDDFCTWEADIVIHSRWVVGMLFFGYKSFSVRVCASGEWFRNDGIVVGKAWIFFLVHAFLWSSGWTVVSRRKRCPSTFRMMCQCMQKILYVLVAFPMYFSCQQVSVHWFTVAWFCFTHIHWVYIKDVVNHFWTTPNRNVSWN